jgi:hypothetical protein
LSLFRSKKFFARKKQNGDFLLINLDKSKRRTLLLFSFPLPKFFPVYAPGETEFFSSRNEKVFISPNETRNEIDAAK